MLPITDRNNEYANSICQILKDNGVRATVDERNEKVGYKIREAHNMKVPYLIIVGDDEQANGTISLRGRGGENQSGLKMQDFVERILQEIKTKKI